MTCPKLKIPWPRWAIGNKPNAEQEHENYLALERWADGILKCIPASGGTHPWMVATREACTQNLGTGATTGAWDIIAEVGGFTTDGELITVPDYGIYAWAYAVSWDTSSSLDGSVRPGAGAKIGDWQFEYQAIASSWGQVLTDHPVFYSGSGDFDQTGEFLESGLLPVGFENSASPDTYFISSLNLASWVGTKSGTIQWDESLVLIQLTTGTDSSPTPS